MNAFATRRPLSLGDPAERVVVRRFSSILVHAPDGTVGPAVALGARLAAASGAALTLADTIEPLPAEVLRQIPPGWDVPALARERKVGRLRPAVTRARRSGVIPAVRLLEGTAFEALDLEVRTRPHDVLVVDAPPDGISEESRALVTRLVHGASSPVVLARAPARRRWPRVVVAIDAARSESREMGELAGDLLESARWLADRLGGRLHVLCVWSPSGDGVMRRAGVSAATVQRYHGAARDEVAGELERLVAPFRASIERIHFETGDPRRVIPLFVSGHGIDLIVVGTLARTGLAGRLMGNTAEIVWPDVPCTMMVVPRSSTHSLRRQADAP